MDKDHVLEMKRIHPIVWLGLGLVVGFAAAFFAHQRPRQAPAISQIIGACEEYLHVVSPGYGVEIASTGAITIQPFK